MIFASYKLQLARYQLVTSQSLNYGVKPLIKYQFIKPAINQSFNYFIKSHFSPIKSLFYKFLHLLLGVSIVKHFKQFKPNRNDFFWFHVFLRKSIKIQVKTLILRGYRCNPSGIRILIKSVNTCKKVLIFKVSKVHHW